jgi:hypothetical protein
MPIFARTKITIEDDCLKPPGVPYLTLSYSGPNPQLLYRKVKELILTVWRSDLNELQEKEFAWDRSGGGEKFSVRFELTKDLDTFSYLEIIVSLSGEAVPSKEFGKEGSATIKIDPKVRTEYPQDTLWQRSFFYEMFRVFYHRVIYEDARKRYKDQCRADAMLLNDEIKAFLNIIPKG